MVEAAILTCRWLDLRPTHPSKRYVFCLWRILMFDLPYRRKIQGSLWVRSLLPGAILWLVRLNGLSVRAACGCAAAHAGAVGQRIVDAALHHRAAAGGRAIGPKDVGLSRRSAATTECDRVGCTSVDAASTATLGTPGQIDQVQVSGANEDGAAVTLAYHRSRGASSIGCCVGGEGDVLQRQRAVAYKNRSAQTGSGGAALVVRSARTKATCASGVDV